MPANERGDKPANVSLNLDSLDREGSDKPEPFVVVLGGERYEFQDLGDEDWQTVADVDENDPRETLRLVLGDRYDAFAAHKLPLWKLRRLLDEWQKHVTGLDAGNAPASST